jgi:hypothetical protein
MLNVFKQKSDGAESGEYGGYGAIPRKICESWERTKSCIVRMNDETSARYNCVILEKQLQDHTYVTAEIKFLIFWKRVDKMETV